MRAPPSDRPTPIRSLLRRIGLEEREIEVYLAILALGSARARDIAKIAKQSRSHTYLVLRALEKRGLVSEVERGNVTHFLAEPPEKLVGHLDDRTEELTTLRTLVTGALPLLKSLTKQQITEPRITLLHGLDGMKQVYREVLSDEICGLFNAESMYRAFGRSIVPMLFGKGGSLWGRDLIVQNKDTARYLREHPQSDRYRIRLLPRNVQFEADTAVSGDIVALFAYDADLTIIRIQNRNIANSFRAWFDVLWKEAKKTKS